VIFQTEEKEGLPLSLFVEKKIFRGRVGAREGAQTLNGDREGGKEQAVK